jgi:predicted nucleic acid-binding protein
MIVLDASIVVELLLETQIAPAIRRELSVQGESFLAPHLLDIEVASTLRRLTSGQRVDAHRSRELLSSLAALPVERYAHTPLLGRIWELRHNFTPYEATYIALAEATNSALYTTDAKLTKGHRARVVLVRG